MLLEKIDAQKKSFTLKFADSDVVGVMFGTDKWGYNEMRVEVSKKDAEDNFTERFELRYTWNFQMEEAPPFVMDMMSLIHRLAKMNADNEVPLSVGEKMKKCAKCEEMEDKCECEEPEWMDEEE